MLPHYYDSLCKDFHQQFLEILQNRKREMIHDLRVNMKQQVAFFHLLEHLDPSFSAKAALQSFGDLYHLAGQVRDLQVEKKVVRHRLRPEMYFLSWLKEQEKEERGKLQTFELEHTLIPIRDLEHDIRRRINHLDSKIFNQCLQSYFDALLNKIRDALAENDRLQRLHYMRKRTKELFYNLLLLESFFPGFRIKKKLLKKLNKVQEMLGQWHDLDFTWQRLAADPAWCPPKVRRKLEKDLGAITEDTLVRIEELPPLVDLLQAQIDAIIQSDRELTKTPPPSPPPPMESFEQVNLEEDIR